MDHMDHPRKSMDGEALSIRMVWMQGYWGFINKLTITENTLVEEYSATSQSRSKPPVQGPKSKSGRGRSNTPVANVDSITSLSDTPVPNYGSEKRRNETGERMNIHFEEIEPNVHIVCSPYPMSNR